MAEQGEKNIGILGTTINTEGQFTGYGWHSTVLIITHFIPTLAVTVRKLHDTGKNGYWLLYPLILYLPIVVGVMLMMPNPMIAGGLIVLSLIGIVIIGIMILIFLCKDSHQEANQYGVSPKHG